MMNETKQYRIRPVSRYVVTTYTEKGGSHVIAELPTRVAATKLVQGLTKSDEPDRAWYNVPMTDLPVVLRNIAEDAESFDDVHTRGAVVLWREDGAAAVYGLGSVIGDPHEVLDRGHAELDRMYPDHKYGTPYPSLYAIGDAVGFNPNHLDPKAASTTLPATVVAVRFSERKVTYDLELDMPVGGETLRDVDSCFVHDQID